MAGETRITNDYVILVEGKDEQNFFPALADARQLPLVQFLPYNGKSELGPLLRTLPKLPDFARVRGLGVTRDADDSFQGAYESVTALLRSARLPVPAGELTAAQGKPVTAVFILPGGQQPGALEDTLLASVNGLPTLLLVEDFVARVEQLRNAALSEAAKAKVRSYMAVQDPSHDLLGASAKAGVWPLTNAAFDGIETLIRIVTGQTGPV